MPETNTSVTNSPTSTTWLDEAPGADLPFSELFGESPDVSSTATETQTTAAPDAASVLQTTPEPVTQTTSSFRISTKTGTIYDSLEAATSGIEEKDTVIEQLRQRFIATTGVDPLKKNQTPPPSPADTPNYLQDPDKYAQDLYSAAKKNDAKGYQRTQLQLFEQYLGPALPMFQEFVRERAQDQVSSTSHSLPAESKTFREFRNSPAFSKVMEQNGVLAQAVTNAEQNFQFASQLPELYRLVYNTYVASNLPEVVRAAPAAVANVTTTPPSLVRQSSTTTLSPTSPSTSQSDNELLRTKDGRAEIKRRFEASGMGSQDWDRVNWGSR